MGCNQSSDAQWAKANNKAPIIVQDPTMNGYNNTMQQNIDPVVEADVLERYIHLEEEIASAEKESPGMVLQQKKQQTEQLTTRIRQQEELVDKLKQHSSSDESVHQMLDTQDTEDDSNREKVAAAHSQEIASSELTSLNEQKNNLENEIRELETKAEKLQALYSEQEDLLNQIFGGAYGSEEENRLESILDQTEEMRNRIVEANFKWRQSQMMVDYAHKQLEHAVAKWKEIETIDPSHLEQRYTVAAETRNNLVAAAQNIQGAQRYLSNIEFPYCAPAEVDTLNKATAYIFTDMQTKDRHEHAMQCYSVTAKRCGALLQWITQVVTQTISRDLNDINVKVKDASLNLRVERVKLIKQKVRDVLGKDVDIAIGEVNTDVAVNLNLNDLAKTEGIDPKTLADLDLTESELAALAAMSGDDDLAPHPSNDQLFGAKMEALKSEFQEDSDRYAKQVEENQSRVKQSLADTLAKRRQRRARKNVEEKQKSVLNWCKLLFKYTTYILHPKCDSWRKRVIIVVLFLQKK